MEQCGNLKKWGVGCGGWRTGAVNAVVGKIGVATGELPTIGRVGPLVGVRALGGAGGAEARGMAWLFLLDYYDCG